MHTTKSLAAYRDELQKCVLACANCHGEIEARLIASPPAGATFEDVLHRFAWRLGITGGVRGRRPAWPTSPIPEQTTRASARHPSVRRSPRTRRQIRRCSRAVPATATAEQVEGGEESYGGDQDAESTATAEQVDEDAERDQAEG
jgi:hypothetical protein